LILSNIAVLKDDFAQAEEWLEQVLDEYPDDISAKNDLGYLWADQNKNLERALEMIQAAVAAEPENAAYRDSLGWVFFRLGRYDEAVVELKKAAEVDEPDGVILEHLGDACQAAGQHDLARETWQRALEHFEKHNETDKAKRVKEKLEAGPKKTSPGKEE
jgi:tetratricopeptide (TPR) repeat protein